MKNIDFTIDSGGLVGYTSSGTIVNGENNVTRITATFPMEFADWEKYIIFYTKRGIADTEGNLMRCIEALLVNGYFDLPLTLINAGIEEVSFRAVGPLGEVFPSVIVDFLPMAQTLFSDGHAALEPILTGLKIMEGENIEIAEAINGCSKSLQISLKRPLQNPLELWEVNGLTGELAKAQRTDMIAEYMVNEPVVGSPVLTDLVGGVFTLNNHGLSLNNAQGFTDMITFKANAGGALPSGIMEGVCYLINNDTQNTFTIMDEAYNDINNFASAGSNYEIRLAGAYTIDFGSTANPLLLEKGYSYTFAVYIYAPYSGAYFFRINNKTMFLTLPISMDVPEKWSCDFVFGEQVSPVFLTQEIEGRIDTWSNTIEDNFINRISFISTTYIPNGTKIYLLRR